MNHRVESQDSKNRAVPAFTHHPLHLMITLNKFLLLNWFLMLGSECLGHDYLTGENLNWLNLKNNMIETTWIKFNFWYGFVHVIYQTTIQRHFKSQLAHYSYSQTDKMHIIGYDCTTRINLSATFVARCYAFVNYLFIVLWIFILYHFK